jgi:hypothetical protein
MKAYLINRPPDVTKLGFNSSPRWLIPRFLAEQHCSELNSVRPKWSLRHYCRFEIEEVSPDRFAVICPNHPKLKSDRTPPQR